MGIGLVVVVVLGVFAVGTTVAGVFSDRRGGLDGQAARRAALRRELMRTPATPIAAIKDGDRVRVQGKVVARGPLRTSPVSQRACVGFRLKVAHGHSVAYEQIIDQDELDSIVLSDGTGEVILDAPFRVELDPYDARTANVPDAVFELARQTGANLTMFGSPDQLAYVEIVVQPGDELIAVGRATVEIDPAGRASSHREPPVVRRLKGDDEPVVLADAEKPIT